MKSLDSVDPWGALNKYNWLISIRVILGILIIFKGLTFTFNFQSLFNTFIFLIGDSAANNGESFILSMPVLPKMFGQMSTLLAAFLSTYIIASHLLGGALLAFGLFTRWTCLIQIPILLGAVFIVNVPGGIIFMDTNIELVTSIIILIGLVFFFVMGAGANSIDEFRRHRHHLENQVI